LISEFHLKKQEILFEYTLPEIMLLIGARVQRLEESAEPKKEKEQAVTGTVQGARQFFSLG